IGERVAGDLAGDRGGPGDETDVLEVPRAVDPLADDAARTGRPGRVVERDPALVDDLRHPLVEVRAHVRLLMRAVAKQELDRLVEVVRSVLRERRQRRDEVGDSGALDVRL